MKIAAVVVAAVLAAGCGAEVKVETKTEPAAAPAASAYPLDTCVVSGEKLGGMGDPVIHKYEGVEVRFCCSKCIKEFDKDPKKYMAVLEAARKK